MMNILPWIIAGVFLLILIFIYNRLVSYRNNVKDAWSNIDVFLKKRYELVPILVSTVKGYANHEHRSFLEVAQARNRAMEIPQNEIGSRETAEDQLSLTLQSVVILQEDYPELKASSSFLDLQKQLAEIEVDLEKSRRYYNATVRENNTFGERFPVNMFAQLFGYKKYEFFRVKDDERNPRDIDFKS